MERKLLAFNESAFNSALSSIRSARSYVQTFVDKINEIGNYKVDTSGLSDLLFGRGESVALRIQEAVDEDMKRAKIGSSSVRDAACKADLEKFYKAYRAFVKPDSIRTQLLSINPEGSVVITPEAEADLREEHSSYISTEKGLRLYEAQVRMVDAMNEFMEASPKVNRLNFNKAFHIPFGEDKIVLNYLRYDD